MSELTGKPRLQITHEAGYPLAVPVNVIRVVARAIAHAWTIICADPDRHLEVPSPKNPAEDVYTEAICNLLCGMLHQPVAGAPGFTSEMFESVGRCESLPNYNGTAINKQPDLIVRLANGPLGATRRLVGVFVESKVISMTRAIDKYTDDGVLRFVRGDYAWTMKAALMLGYQVPRPRPLSSLESKLGSDATLCCEPQPSYLSVLPELAPLSAASLHGRPWSYPCGDAPGQIRLWHMWDLTVPERFAQADLDTTA